MFNINVSFLDNFPVALDWHLPERGGGSRVAIPFCLEAPGRHQYTSIHFGAIGAAAPLLPAVCQHVRSATTSLSGQN
ncbi:hypothetical protein MJ581_02330 [Escherichia coli]|nr:hypothetical protein MJ581_02330 [Escherichia coli]